jgi:hypothetical protein
MRTRLIPAIVAAVALSSGCLQKDVTETWYLGSNGAVAWVVTESDVRSDAQAPADRQNEEQSYRLAFERQDHPVARGFRVLGFQNVQTVVLRGEVPFTVRTQAQGMTIDALGLRILQRAGLAGVSTLERDGDAWVWRFTARDPHAQDVTTSIDDDVAALLNDLDALKVVLIEGRFESAAGFTLSGDKRVASLIEPDNHREPEGADESVVTLRLRWSASQD